jgi:hypothetical protein
MRPFHLAVAVHDLDAARAFYGGLLRCAEGRCSADWVDFDLCGHQLVCHLDRRLAAPRTEPGRPASVDGHDVPIPHFGVVLLMPEWQALATHLTGQGVHFIVAPHIRFAGQAGEQATLFLADPSGNAVEFKGFRSLDALFARD